jgi:hypothetical protein
MSWRKLARSKRPEYGAMPAEPNLPPWSDAEVLDVPIPDGIMLRAVACPLAPGKWQWSVMAVDGDRGELISIGIEDNAAAARLTAISEIEKCVGE